MSQLEDLQINGIYTSEEIQRSGLSLVFVNLESDKIRAYDGKPHERYWFENVGNGWKLVDKYETIK
jgi:hypothetical protein